MMTGTKMQLIQYSTFHAQGKKKNCSRVLYQQKRGRIQSSESWSRVPIQIPAVVPSTLLFCNPISVNYRIVVSIFKNWILHCSLWKLLLIQFTVETGKFARNVVVPLDIIIGNIPERRFIPEFSAPSASPAESLLGDGPLQASNKDQYPDLRKFSIIFICTRLKTIESHSKTIVRGSFVCG